MCLILKFVNAPDTAKLTTLVASACPVGSSIQLLALQYKQNSKLASLLFGFSTLLCLITIPLMVSVYGAF